MTFLAVGLLAVAVVLVSLARRTAGRPPLWRSKVAFAGALVCVTAAVVLVAVDPALLVETPVLYIAAFGMFEGALALISLVAAAGWSAPRWLI
jgi:hypothetical protein